MTSTEQPVYAPPIDRPVRRRWASGSLLTAVGIFVVGALLTVINGIAGVFEQVFVSAGAGVTDYLLPALSQTIPLAIAAFLPAAIVVFLFFWGAMPIRTSQSIGGVIGRGIATAVVALILGALVNGVRIILDNRASITPPGQPIYLHGLEASLVAAFGEAVGVFVLLLPLVVLGAVLLRVWIRMRAAEDTPTSAPALV